MNQKLTDILFLLVAIAIIVIPLTTMNLKPNQISTTENRNLTELPTFSNGITPFMSEMNNYVNDRIGLRDDMMQIYNNWKYIKLNGNHDKVIIGKNGWLFYKESLPDYTGTNIIPAKTTGQVQILTTIDTWCKERGITFVLAIGPNKSSIYSQYMPNYIYHAPISNLDMLLEALKETDVKVYCPKEELLAHQDETELYFRQDTHWNSYGGHYLLDEITTGLNLPNCNATITDSRASAGDLLTMLGTGANSYTTLYTAVEPPKDAYIEKPGGSDYIIHSPNTASFICYRDSFTNSMIDFYSYYFNGPVYWRYDIDFDYLERERPQYVILSCVERYLDPAINANASIVNR